MGPYEEPACSEGSSVNHRPVDLSKRGAMLSWVATFDGAVGKKAEDEPNRARTATATVNNVVVMVLLYCHGITSVWYNYRKGFSTEN